MFNKEFGKGVIQPMVGVITAPLKQQSPPDCSGRLCTQRRSRTLQYQPPPMITLTKVKYLL
jgi:hypothetical protein